MSTIVNRGESISKATNIIVETYKNLDILFKELDRVGEECGYVTITPRFMRYKSDTDFEGWMITNFLKLYVKSEKLPTSIDDIRELDWYGIMVELKPGDYAYPTISIIKYDFDQSYWNRLPAVSDHWLFFLPFYEEGFIIEQEENVWKSSCVNEKTKKKYQGYKRAIAVDLPLFEVNTAEDIKAKLFNAFDQLVFDLKIK